RVPQRTVHAAAVHERALLVLRLGLLLLLNLVWCESELLSQLPRRAVTMLAGVLRDPVVLVGTAHSVTHVLAVGGVLDVPVVQEPPLTERLRELANDEHALAVGLTTLAAPRVLKNGQVDLRLLGLLRFAAVVEGADRGRPPLVVGAVRREPVVPVQVLPPRILGTRRHPRVAAE